MPKIDSRFSAFYHVKALILGVANCCFGTDVDIALEIGQDATGNALLNLLKIRKIGSKHVH